MFRLFLKGSDIPYTKQIYIDVEKAFDAEENLCYDELFAGRESPEIEVWEIDYTGKKVKEHFSPV